MTEITAPFRVLSVGDCTVALELLARSPGAHMPVRSVTSAEEVIDGLEELAAGHRAGGRRCRRRLPASRSAAMLKEHPATMLLPVVVLSRSSRRRVAALGAGADDFITRQTRQEVFHERVAAVVRTGATRRQLAAARLSNGDARATKTCGRCSAAICRRGSRTRSSAMRTCSGACSARRTCARMRS